MDAPTLTCGVTRGGLGCGAGVDPALETVLYALIPCMLTAARIRACQDYRSGQRVVLLLVGANEEKGEQRCEAVEERALLPWTAIIVLGPLA